ncbi:Ankyrin repeat-containing domain [Penicillium camemberti]|uniref:Ankyrin repeat-containing domain n=1 Tax=Penicillium camemberti (strain FM 013) TaxID=1429867 RepID=A0A0G4PI15_PENC3|nr:Ankyrin repeat-containing domain [Penicillium camemberti]
MVTFLVEQGGAPDLQDPYRRTPIGYAIRNGHYEIEQILKDRVNVGMSLAQGI